MYNYDYRGVVHLHSTYSDGHGSVEEIMECANQVGLDFVMLTDHDTMKPLDDGHEKWHSSSLLICGTEITPRYNHYTVFGAERLNGVEELAKKQPQEIIDEINRQGWLGFIAHPDHEGTKRFDIPSYKWQDWNVNNFTGIGLWDLMTDWQEKLDKDNITVEVYTEFAKHVSGPKDITLKRWDELNKNRRVVGIGEIDNHKSTKEYNGQKIVVFPYDVAFRTITNHILLNKPLDRDFKKAKEQVLSAFRDGKVYVSFDYWDDPSEFVFEIEEGDNCAYMGDELKLKEQAEVIVSLPASAYINVICDSETIWEGEGDEAIVPTNKPGVYRVEVYKNDLTWILSNPIYVR